MKGNCLHLCYATSEGKEPGVILYNNNDEFYCQIFETRAELDAFIARLEDVADEQWPAIPKFYGAANERP